MPTIRYTGDSPLDIPSLGVQVAPGESIDVDAETAAGLLARPDFARPRSSAAAAPKAAAPSPTRAPAPVVNKSKED